MSLPGAAARKTERLLDLLVLLLGAEQPLPFSQIRAQFPDYDTKKAETGARAFERDKRELLLLGIPLRCFGKGEVAPRSDEELTEDAYFIDREQYLLPSLDLSREEVAALAVVAQVTRAQLAFPYREEIDSALRKITFDADAPEVPRDLRLDLGPGVEGRRNQRHLRLLEEAVRARKRIEVRYRKPGERGDGARSIDPYGLVYRHGGWLVVGWCHTRREVRTFRVDRMTHVRVAGKPAQPDFERPAGLDVRAIAHRSAWTFEVEPATTVVLETTPELAHLGREDFGRDAVREALPTGSLRLRFRCGNPGYVVARVLAAAGRLRVLSPPALRSRIRETADELGGRYR